MIGRMSVTIGEDGKFNTRHSLTGKLERLTPDQISTAPDYLEIVPDDAKPYEPGMFRPGKVGEFDNVEPLTDAQIAAQAEYDAVLVDHAPNSGVARDAKKKLDATNADAEAAKAEAERAAAEIQDQAPEAPDSTQGE